MKHENINSVQQKQFWKCVNWPIMKTLLFVEYQMDVASLIINNCDVCATRIPIILTYDKLKKKKNLIGILWIPGVKVDWNDPEWHSRSFS